MEENVVQREAGDEMIERSKTAEES